MLLKVLAVDLLEAVSSKIEGKTSALWWGWSKESKSITSWNRGWRASSGSWVEEARRVGGSVEIPKAGRSSCASVVE